MDGKMRNPGKAYAAAIGKIILAGIIALFLLSAFSYAYYHTGLRIKSESGATDYHWEPNALISTMKEGFSWIKTDANGYNNVSIPAQIDILIMGSSHMEAVEVAQNENTVAQLNMLLPDMYVYNIGISGHTIYRCVDNISSAIENFKPTSYVVIETNKIRLDVDEMEAVISGHAVRESASSGGRVMSILQRIPAFKPLYSQIEAWMAQDRKIVVAQSGESSEAENYYAVLEAFLGIVGEAAETDGIQAIIFYDPPQEYDEDGLLDYFHTDKEVTLFKEACEQNNIVFMDLTDTFAAAFQADYTLAHGFANTGVGLGHLNRDGHRMIAEVLAAEIGKDKNDYK